MSFFSRVDFMEIMSIVSEPRKMGLSSLGGDTRGGVGHVRASRLPSKCIFGRNIFIPAPFKMFPRKFFRIFRLRATVGDEGFANNLPNGP
jgi:hypothetical protein